MEMGFASEQSGIRIASVPAIFLQATVCNPRLRSDANHFHPGRCGPASVQNRVGAVQ